VIKKKKIKEMNDK